MTIHFISPSSRLLKSKKIYIYINTKKKIKNETTFKSVNYYYFKKWKENSLKQTKLKETSSVKQVKNFNYKVNLKKREMSGSSSIVKI